MILLADDAELVLAPATGGSVAAWRIGGLDMLRTAISPDVRDSACYPLVPFSGRIADRAFSFAGTRYTLPATLGPWAIHGAGWQSAWQETRAGHLTLDHRPGPLWPFAFFAEQIFELTARELTCTFRVTNRHDAPAPAGVGLHPFFPRNSQTRLYFQAKGVWRNDASMIPSAETAIPPEWDFSSEREIGEPDIDNCFSGWGHAARIVWPDRGLCLTLRAPALSRLVVYVPPGQPFLCVEPVSNISDGLNYMETAVDHGMTILAPGETLQVRITMTIEELQ